MIEPIYSEVDIAQNRNGPLGVIKLMFKKGQIDLAIGKKSKRKGYHIA